jgi:trk system potassium uptake protein TrkH
MQLSPVLNILGLLATILAAAMLIPMGVDLYAGSDDWQVFALSALLTWLCWRVGMACNEPA